MKIEAYPLADFQEIEPILYEYYGLNKMELSNAIFFANELLLNTSRKAEDVDTENMIFLPLAPQHEPPIGTQFGTIGDPDFCRKYNIEKDSFVGKALSFVYMFFPIEKASDLDTE